MLAEPRRKNRIGPNPRGKFFTEDDDNRGRQMLKKMGWKTGDGLGANCHGMSEPIKPKVNTESRGLGFDRKQDPWVAHNEEFEQLLKSLNSNSSDGDADGSQGRKDTIREDGSGASKDALEKKSKGSKSRIHYHKFVKNKDLSGASFKDMSCIFGKSLDAVVQLLPTSAVDDDESLELKVNGINFELASPSEVTEEIIKPEESSEEKKKKKKKKKKNKETEERDETPSPSVEDQGIQLEEILDEAEDTFKSERKSKKKKRKQKELADELDIENNCNGNNKIEEIHAESISDKDKQFDDSDTGSKIHKKKKKSKKRKREDDGEAQDEVLQNILETTTITTTLDGIEPDSSTDPAALEEPETKKKKKKKSKKAHREREEISEEMAIATPNISAESDLAPPPHKEAEPNKDTIPSEKVETLGMQFINRGSIVDYFRNKRLQMLNRIAANSVKIA